MKYKRAWKVRSRKSPDWCDLIRTSLPLRAFIANRVIRKSRPLSKEFTPLPPTEVGYSRIQLSSLATAYSMTQTTQYRNHIIWETTEIQHHLTLRKDSKSVTEASYQYSTRAEKQSIHKEINRMDMSIGGSTLQLWQHSEARKDCRFCGTVLPMRPVHEE
jgi:hypothetical protein